MKYRFNGFTEKANNAMNLAISSAEELGHDYVGSEHVMLGLLKEGTGVAYTVLNKLGVTAEAYEKLIRERIGTGEPTALSTEEFTPRTKRILQVAAVAGRSFTMRMWVRSTCSSPSSRMARATPCASCRFWEPTPTASPPSSLPC